MNAIVTDELPLENVTPRKTRSAVAVQPPAQAVAPVNETAAVMSMIERVAMNPDVDIDRLERLLDMQERIVARNAKGAYLKALSDMQPELPIVTENGEIKHKADGPVISTYALWEDINEAIRPILSKHGFSLTFRVNRPEGMIDVTGVLGHRDGHSEETTLTLPCDSSGAKNAVQAIGSSISYGKRYTANMLLNITSRGEDDDGEHAVNNKSSANAKRDGDWDKIEEQFSECEDVPTLIKVKDRWKAYVPRSWLGSLQDKFEEHKNRIKWTEFKPK